MTIHSDHPFWPAEGDRDPLRRFRGRLSSPVTVWATGTGRDRAGLTVSSLLVADGEPPRALALIDEESSLWEAAPHRVVVNLLGPDHGFLADAFAGTAPAPGGPFTLGEWEDGAWGPVLRGAAGWLGVTLDRAEPRRVGWSLLLEGDVEHAEVGTVEALAHVRGRYRT
ncbi:flavin reductase family protein [Aeromicrobium sp. CTD01-1L150]|uniref:flavin reductase family protein n=1 Tax=Aeromicrobium sp. CTD01-1L150 TaxID=3341830 RepID=UPI0035BF1811